MVKQFDGEMSVEVQNYLCHLGALIDIFHVDATRLEDIQQVAQQDSVA